MKTRNMKKKQGFTIIELMIVLVIVAILLALAYPSYVDPTTVDHVQSGCLSEKTSRA